MVWILFHSTCEWNVQCICFTAVALLGLVSCRKEMNTYSVLETKGNLQLSQQPRVQGYHVPNFERRQSSGGP
jgi:hypothetical protein